MESKAILVKQATQIAEDNFDKQMLDHLTIIKSENKFHNQHRTLLLEYVYNYKRKGK